MKLLKELQEKEWIILRVKGSLIKNAISEYLKQYYSINNNDFEIYINDISGIYDLDIKFEDDNFNEFLENEALYGSELISNALDFSLGLEDTHCAIFPENINSAEYVLIEIPKSILC